MVEKIEENENSSGNTLKLAKATANILTDSSGSRLLFTEAVDNMEIPTDFHKLIKICRFFYKRDPVAGTVINKMVDCAITPITNRKSKCTDTEFYVYDALSDMLQAFFRNACLEYLLSGLVVPEYEWNRIRGSDLSQELGSRMRFKVPDNIWFRDPATIKVKNSPISNKKYYYVTISTELINFIRNDGKLKDGTYDKEAYDALVKNYPAFVKAIKELKGTKVEIRLEDIRPILSKTLAEDAYPIPYMSNALESLMHKRNLRKMDYSVAARVTSAIQLIRLGSDEFPCTDEGDFDHIKSQMNYRVETGRQERLFQLFGNHTLQIEWIFPNTEAMLNVEKYRSVDDDIISAFGFPRTLITGETLRSNVQGGSDFAAFSPIATMETIRDILIEWLKTMYKEIKEQNNFKSSPIPNFTPMRLYKLLDLSMIGESLYKEGNLSRQTRQEVVGFDFETEIERKEQETKLYKEKGIPEAPEVPYSSPNIGKVDKETTDTKEEKVE